MPRIARKDISSQFIHVMVQGVNKEYIFNNTYYIEEYLKIIESESKKYSIEIIAYCIMNNHAHFLIYTDSVKELGCFMHDVNQSFAMMYNKENDRCGVMFRNRYTTEQILDQKYLINCIKYIHNNPVKAKMVSQCSDYKYSSYSEYVNNTIIYRCDIIRKIFGENCDFNLLFNKAYDRRFFDIDTPSTDETEKYINAGIEEFIRNEKIKIEEIFGNRILLKKLIKFLKEICNIKYTELGEYFEITRGTMTNLKK